MPEDLEFRMVAVDLSGHRRILITHLTIALFFALFALFDLVYTALVSVALPDLLTPLPVSSRIRSIEPGPAQTLGKIGNCPS